MNDKRVRWEIKHVKQSTRKRIKEYAKANKLELADALDKMSKEIK